MFPHASERRPIDSQVHEEGQTILKCHESSFRGKLRLLRLKCPSEQCRYLQLRGKKLQRKTSDKDTSCGSACLVVTKSGEFGVCSSQWCWLCCDLVRQVQACRSQSGLGVRLKGQHCRQWALLMPPGRDQQMWRQGRSVGTAEMFGFCCFCLLFLTVFSGVQTWP